MATASEIALSILIGAKLQGSFAQSFSSAQGTVSSFAKVSTAALTAVGTAVAAMTVTSVKQAAEYQTQLQNVATLIDGTKAQVAERTAEIGQEVLTISNATGLITADLTDGMYQVISAFGDSAESAGVLEVAAKSAAAGNATTTESINLLSAVTKGYGDISLEAQQKAADLAFQTVKLGQTSFPELASSIGKVIPLANTLGVSQEQLFGSFATLTGVTGNTAEVATQMKASLQGFLQPSAAMATALEKLGYSSGQAMLQQEGLQGALNLLKESVNGNEIAFSDLFSSVEAKTAVLALAGTQSENLTAKTQAMYDAAGAATAAYETQTQTFSHQIEVAKNLATNTLTSVGMELLPILSELMTELSPVFQELATMLSETISETMPIIMPIASEVITVVMSGLKQLLPYLPQILTPMMQLVTNVLPLIMESVKQIMPAITALIPVIIQLMNAMMPIITDVITVLIPPITTIITSLLPVLMQIIQALIPLINVLNPIIYMLANAFGESLAQGLQMIMPIIQNIMGVFQGLIDFITGVFTGNWQQAWEGVKGVFSNTFGALGNIIKLPINAVIGIINSAIAGINSIAIDFPDWVPGLGCQTYGFNISQIPILENGGIVTSPTLSMIGEGSEPEAVIPLSKLANMLNTATYTYSTVSVADNYVASGNAVTLSQLESMLTAVTFSTVSVEHSGGISENVNTLSQLENMLSSVLQHIGNEQKIVYSPTYHITGNVNRKDIEDAQDADFERFKQFMKKYNKEKQRVSF